MTNKATATAHKMHHSPDIARPFGTVTIRQDGTSTKADIVNEGTINFIVDFPPGANVCTVKLDVDFSSLPEHEKHELREGKNDKTGGGTIVIGG